MVGLIFLALIYLFRGTLLSPYISPLLEDIIESQLGLRLSVGGIGGSYVTGIELHDVKTLDAAGPVVSIEVQRLKISYSLPSLLKGGDALLGALTLELDGARLDLDVSQGGQRESPEGQPVALPGLLPRIRAQNIFVSIRGPNSKTPQSNLYALCPMLYALLFRLAQSHFRLPISVICPVDSPR